MVDSLPISPSRSVASIIAAPIRSLTEPSALKNSHLTTISASRPAMMRLSRTSGVRSIVLMMSTKIWPILCSPEKNSQSRIGGFPLLWIKLVGERDGKRKLESRTETAEQIQPARTSRARRKLFGDSVGTRDVTSLRNPRLQGLAVPPRKENRQNQDEIVLCERFVTQAQKYKNVPDTSQQPEIREH